MNVVQFWLIDSIVKASAAAVAAQDIESSLQDREPLFREDDDDQSPPRLETANYDSSRCSISSLDSRNLEPRVDTSYQNTTTTPEEYKSSASSFRHLVNAYVYPPSLSSSISSDRSTLLNHHEGFNSVSSLAKKSPLSPAQRPTNPSSQLSPIPRTPSPRSAISSIAQDDDIWEDRDGWDKDYERISTISKQNVNGSWRGARTVEPMPSRQHLRSD